MRAGRAADVALVAGITTAYCALGLIIWWRGGAAEDAYILFKYARMVGEGHGIVFYPGGPRSEGATDFLWMLALALGSSAGLVPAVTGCILNAAGLSSVLCSYQALARGAPRGRRWILVVALTLLVSPCATAGMLGFGTTCYAALCLQLYLAYVTRRSARVAPLALLVALIRPDGAVLAGSFALLQLVTWERVRDRTRTALGWAAAAVVGAGYFVWRWHYFGDLLPLPLLVKSHFPLPAPGIADMIDWVWSTAVPMLVLLALARVIGGRAGLHRSLLLGLLPFAVHLLAFLHTTPSQNIANRFEAPAEVVLGFVAVRALVFAPRQAPWRAAVLAVAFVGMQVPRWLIVEPELATALQPSHYVIRFATALAKLEARRPSHHLLRLATTEAGRLAYGLDGPVLDLVGLCSPETAQAPPSFDLLDRFDPDVMVVHPAGTLDENAIDEGVGRDIVKVRRPFASMWWPLYRPMAVPDPARYAAAPWFGAAKAGLVENIRAAPPAALAWIDARRSQYEVFAVHIPARFARYHVVAIKRDLPDHDEIVTALRSAARGGD